MKEYRISEMMENYTDNEFFVEGEQTVDTEKAVRDLLGQVKAKKKAKPLFKVFAAAAAAVIVLTGAATASSLLQQGTYTDAAGNIIQYAANENGALGAIVINGTNLPNILKKENGRLYFSANGWWTTDITDKIDRQTPYIYEYKNTDNIKDYLIAGGTPEEYYLIEMLNIKDFDGYWNGSGIINGNLHDSGPNVHFEWNVFKDGDVFREGGDATVAQILWGPRFYDNDGNHLDLGEGPYPASHTHYIMWHADGTIETDIPYTWRDDCMDAWLIEALIQLEIFPVI